MKIDVFKARVGESMVQSSSGSYLRKHTNWSGVSRCSSFYLHSFKEIKVTASCEVTWGRDFGTGNSIYGENSLRTLKLTKSVYTDAQLIPQLRTRSLHRIFKHSTFDVESSWLVKVRWAVGSMALLSKRISDNDSNEANDEQMKSEFPTQKWPYHQHNEMKSVQALIENLWGQQWCNSRVTYHRISPDFVMNTCKQSSSMKTLKLMTSPNKPSMNSILHLMTSSRTDCLLVLLDLEWIKPNNS